MSPKRKKLKKGKTHYRDPSGVDADSVAGTMREKNKSTKAMIDEIDDI